MLANVRWVLFDAVGTLIHADPPVAEVYHAAGRQFGSALRVDEIQGRFRAAMAKEGGRESIAATTFHNGKSRPQSTPDPFMPTCELGERHKWQAIVRTVFDDVPGAAGELFDKLWRHFAEPQHWRLYDDVEPALHELQRRGLRLGIASNFDGRLSNIVSGLPGLAACERVFVSSQVGYAKPDPRFFAAAASELKVPPEQILLVGDDWQADIEGARAAGWKTLWLSREGTNHDSAISSLAEIAALMPA